MRLFVALELPAAARAALAAWADAAAPPIVRRIPVENLHVTLAFLGSRSEDEATTVGARLADVIRPLGPLRTAGALWLPRRHPGVLTVALRDDEQLSGLQADLAAELESAIDVEPERAPVSSPRDGRTRAARDADRHAAGARPARAGGRAASPGADALLLAHRHGRRALRGAVVGRTGLSDRSRSAPRPRPGSRAK